ncbi:MAG: hypothetical protein ACYSVY_03090 [Planctomycetota bacterium]|jgi:hypothetical protein
MDSSMTNDQLVEELEALRRRVAELEGSPAKPRAGDAAVADSDRLLQLIADASPMFGWKGCGNTESGETVIRGAGR